MNLCIIITGLVRTFFNKGLESFNKMLNISLEKYTKIHIILVISGEYDKVQIEKFILQMKLKTIDVELCEYHIDETNELHYSTIHNNKYLKLREKYLSENNVAKNEISDVDHYLKIILHQFYQLSKGIDNMIEYEKRSNTSFNVCMRTRFDLEYPINFYPLIHENDAPLLDKIFLNKENTDYFLTISNDIDQFIQFLKSQKIILPSCRTPYYKFSFGGSYLNNYVSLENIKAGCNNILYMYNDHVIFGSREQFIKLKQFVFEYGTMETPLNINHFFAAEAQLLIFCFNNNINPIMYLHDCYTIIRS
jgi:hypothetical protein